MITSIPAPAAAASPTASRFSPVVSWWLYHVIGDQAVLYRCDTPDEATWLRDELIAGGAVGMFGRLEWEQNEYHARRKMWLRGWTVVGVK